MYFSIIANLISIVYLLYIYICFFIYKELFIFYLQGILKNGRSKYEDEGALNIVVTIKSP